MLYEIAYDFHFIFFEIMLECIIIAQSIANMKHRKYGNIRLVQSQNLSTVTYLSAPRCNIIIRFPGFLPKLLKYIEFFFEKYLIYCITHCFRLQNMEIFVKKEPKMKIK